MFFILRRIGTLLRGKATPFQIIAGSVLGAMLGFMPGFATAPGLIAALALALILINANLILAALIGLVAKLLALLLLPVSFYVGRALLDGPSEGLFKALVNAPVFALFGFESYVATGGLFVGGLLGLVAGVLVARGITAYRRKMADAGQNSALIMSLSDKPWMRFGLFVFAGGGLKDPDYAALLQKTTGNPVRPLGVVLVVLASILAVVTYQFFAGEIVTTTLRSGLERANGATVDLESAEVDLKAGRMTLTGLAMADPNAPGTDLFRAQVIEADISGANLLRKRLQLDRVVVSGTTSGETRRIPGRRAPTAEKTRVPLPIPDAQTIEDFIRNAQVWRERLAQVRQWLDKLSTPPAEDDAAVAGESLGDRLRRLAAAHGYAGLKATHLITGAPTLLISELQANGVTVAHLPGEVLDITARNLSTQPALAEGAPAITIRSASDRVGFSATLGGVGTTASDGVMAFHYRDLPVDTVMQSLRSTATSLKGGTIDLVASGRYHAGSGTIELPIEATIRGSTLSLGGRDTAVSRFTLPIGVSGALDNPRIKVDAKSLGDLALKAGTEALKSKATEKLQEKAGGLLDRLRGGK